MSKKKKKAKKKPAAKRRANVVASLKRLSEIERELIRTIDKHSIVVTADDRTFSYIPEDALVKIVNDIMSRLKGIYISENGDWGDADSLTFVSVDGLTGTDCEALSSMTQFMLLEYATEHNGRKPAEYLEDCDNELEAQRGMSIVK